MVLIICLWAMSSSVYRSIKTIAFIDQLKPRFVRVSARLPSSLSGGFHKLAHRMEEITHGKGHPADREIDLEMVKGELMDKMRDFVWAIRH